MGIIGTERVNPTTSYDRVDSLFLAEKRLGHSWLAAVIFSP
jgi:hypothetical protein